MALRILVVEDDKHVRRILESLLTNEPSLKVRAPEVVVAGDGADGLKALDQGPFDLVITDLLMPRMDGFQFCRELRNHRFGAQVPLIVTSAVYKDSTTQLRLRKEVGDHQFFAKPYEIRDLIQAVNRILDGNHPETTPPVARAEVAETGRLAERSPPRLLLDLAERKATGTLALGRGKVKKELGFQTGVLVHCDSNLRTETLGHFLVSRGVIDEKQHQAVLTRAQARKELFGQALVELGWISEKDLLHQLAAQMRAKVASTLRWREGDWSFLPGPMPSRLQTPIDAPLLVFLGLQKTAHIDEIAQLLAGARGRLSLTARGERHRETFARVFGIAALDALARQPRLEDLMAGTDPAAMLAQLDALLACGLAELQPADQSEPPREDSTDPVALERITQRPPPAHAPEDNLYDQLFGDEPSEVFRLPVAPRPTRPDAEALRKEILTEYLPLSARNYYEILGVAPDATPEALALAYAQMRERFRLERFADAELGSDYAHVEALHQAFQRAWDTLSNRRAEYDRTLAQEDASRPPIDAELLASEAEALLFAGETARARLKLEQAVAAAPDVAHHRARLGWVTFLASADVDLPAAAADAWPHLEQALAIDPDDCEAHDLAGRVAASSGDDDRAVPHLERALDAQPHRSEALATLEAIYTRRGAYKPLERRYRRLIHRLGEDPARIELWARLAELYLTRLSDLESARVAYEMLARLAPEDARLTQALAQLGSPRGESPEAQMRTHLAAQSWDAAFVAAALAQSPDATELYRRYRPRFLQRMAPIDPAQLFAQRHPDDDAELGQLLEQLLTAQSPTLSLGDLGVTEEDRVPYDFMPSPFRRALLHTAGLLGIGEPPVYRRGDFGADVSPGASEPPVVLAGPQALASPDLPQLAFRFGRALGFLVARRATAIALPIRQLNELLLSALSQAAPPLRAKLLTLDVTRLVRGMHQTAERLGLIACQDPRVALALARAPDDLTTWALSPAHLALREQLGVSVAV